MDVTGHNILLLQGPMGPFFWWLARGLRRKGAKVHKVNFNGGDVLFYPFGGISFRGSLEEWPEFLETLVSEKRIDEIVLFGDCRAYHRLAIGVAYRKGIAVRVFEEGYLRPDWITLEKGGVNGNSFLPTDPSFYSTLEPLRRDGTIKKFSRPFSRMVFFATFYSLAMWVRQWKYPKYEHHRSINPWREAGCWLRSAWRKFRYSRASKKIARLVAGPLHKRYFLYPLQVHNDAQLLYHSPYPNKLKIFDDVIGSFAHHAPGDFSLIIKHHPMDRAYSDFTFCIGELARKYGVEDRVIYCWDAHLPTILRHSCGVVTVNSTVGLQALFHNIPVKALGKAIYNIEGLTDLGFLKDFWKNPTAPDSELYRKFRSYLLNTSQINGSFSYPPTPQLFDRWANLYTGEELGETEELVLRWLEVA